MESGEYLSAVDAAFLFSSKPGWTPLPLIVALGASAECSRWGLSTVSGAKLLNAHSSFRQGGGPALVLYRRGPGGRTSRGVAPFIDSAL